MIPSRRPLSLCSLALLAVLALGGCTPKPTRPAPSPSSELIIGATTRTAEELRVFHGLLSVRKDSDYDFGHLEYIPNGEASPLSLFLTTEELARLEMVDKTQPFEVRYWYHEETYLQSRPFGRGELASLRNEHGVLIDRTVCPRHNEIMKRQLVPISYGLPMREFMEDARRDFPNAAYVLGGCVVENDSPKDAPAYACAACETAHQAWIPPKRDETAPSRPQVPSSPAPP